MVKYKLRNNQQYEGPFTDLYIIGATRAYNAATKTWGSDFTAGTTFQDYNLETPGAGDILAFPTAVLYSKIAVFGPSVTASTASLGSTGGGQQHILAGSVFTANQAYGPLTNDSATAGGLVQVFTGSSTLIARVTTTTVNVNLLTQGEIWIYAMIIRRPEHLNLREA